MSDSSSSDVVEHGVASDGDWFHTATPGVRDWADLPNADTHRAQLSSLEGHASVAALHRSGYNCGNCNGAPTASEAFYTVATLALFDLAATVGPGVGAVAPPNLVPGVVTLLRAPRYVTFRDTDDEYNTFVVDRSPDRCGDLRCEADVVLDALGSGASDDEAFWVKELQRQRPPVMFKPRPKLLRYIIGKPNWDAPRYVGVGEALEGDGDAGTEEPMRARDGGVVLGIFVDWAPVPRDPDLGTRPLVAIRTRTPDMQWLGYTAAGPPAERVVARLRQLCEHTDTALVEGTHGPDPATGELSAARNRWQEECWGLSGEDDF